MSNILSGLQDFEGGKRSSPAAGGDGKLKGQGDLVQGVGLPSHERQAVDSLLEMDSYARELSGRLLFSFDGILNLRTLL